MDEQHNFKNLITQAIVLALLGIGGLYFILTQTLPFVWSRWAFFIFIFITLTGIALPIVTFFHQRFPSDPPASFNIITRQAFWVGVYGSALAWLQLGRLVTLYVILGLAGGIILAEYFIRLREKSYRNTPIISDDESS